LRLVKIGSILKGVMKKVLLSNSSKKLLVKMLEDGMKQMPKSREAKQQMQFMQTLLQKVQKAPKKTEIILNPLEAKYLREVMVQTRKQINAMMTSAGFFKKIAYRIMLSSYKELFSQLI
jgi:hypothetical protein